jgi:hypothetical protein
MMHEPIKCAACDQLFTPARSDAKTCSGACRTFMHRFGGKHFAHNKKLRIEDKEREAELSAIHAKLRAEREAAGDVYDPMRGWINADGQPC